MVVARVDEKRYREAGVKHRVETALRARREHACRRNVKNTVDANVRETSLRSQGDPAGRGAVTLGRQSMLSSQGGLGTDSCADLVDGVGVEGLRRGVDCLTRGDALHDLLEENK